MAAVRPAQEVSAEDPDFVSSGTTIAVAITVKAGRTVVIWCGNDSTAAATITVSDNVNGAYTQDGATVNDAANGQQWAKFVFVGSAAAALTVTMTLTAANVAKAIWAQEWSGVRGVVGGAGQLQATPTTTTDATTSGTAAPTRFTAMLLGFCAHQSATPTAATAGTGFATTKTAFAWGSGTVCARTEYKRVTNAAAVAATYTAALNDAHTTLSLLLEETPDFVRPGPSPFFVVGPGRFKNPQLSPLMRFEPFESPATPAVDAPPLSWEQQGQQLILGAAVAPQGGAVGPLVPIVAATVPPLSWEAVLDTQSFQPIPSASAARTQPFPAAFPVTPLAWRPETWIAPPEIIQPQQQGIARSMFPIAAVGVTPLSWAPSLDRTPPAAPAPAPVFRVVKAYEASPGAADVSWQAETQVAFEPAPPPPFRGSIGPVAPVSGAVLPPLAWQGWRDTGVIPVALPPTARAIAPFAPALPVAALAWQPELALTSDPPLPGGRAGVYAPLLPGFVVVPLEWGPRGLTVFGLAPAPASSNAVAPFAPNVLPPGVGWLPRIVVPPAPASLASTDRAPALLTPPAAPPLSWAPSLAGPPPGLAMPPAGGRVGPFAPSFPVPALAWAPDLAPPPVFFPILPSQAFVGPLVPIAAIPVVPMSWAPRLAPAGQPTAPVPFGGAVAPLSPAFPVAALSWAPRGAPAVLDMIPAPPALGARPGLFAIAPPLAWAPAGRAAALGLDVIAVARAAAPVAPPAALGIAWWPGRASGAAAEATGAVARAIAPIAPPAVAALLFAGAAPPLVLAPIFQRGHMSVAPLAPLVAPPGWAAIAERTAEIAYLPLLLEPAPRLSTIAFPVLPQPNPPAPTLSWQAISGLWFPPPVQLALELTIGPVVVGPAPPPSIPLPLPLVVVLRDHDGDVVDLTDKTVITRFQPVDRSRTVKLESADVLNAREGVVRKTWVDADLRGLPTGIMLLQFIVIDLALRQRTYPIGTYYRVPFVGRPR